MSQEENKAATRIGGRARAKRHFRRRRKIFSPPPHFFVTNVQLTPTVIDARARYLANGTLKIHVNPSTASLLLG